MAQDYQDIGLNGQLFKQSQTGVEKIDPDTQIDDGSIQGIKLMTKSVSLDKLYGQDLVIGGSSNISGSLYVNDNTNVSRITLDATNGIDVSDSGGSVFSALISGTNAGDITLGNYSGSSGLFYDSSAGTFNVKGAFTLGSGSAVDGQYVINGTLTANKLNVSQLSAITADLGTITAGSITGNTITLNQSTDAGASTSAYLRWSGGSKIWSDTSNNMGINSIGSGGMYIYTDNGQRVYIGSSNINLYPATTYLKKIDFAFDGQTEGNIDHVDIIRGANDIRFQTISGSFKFLDPSGNDILYINHLNGTIEFHQTGGTIRVPSSSGTNITVNGTNKTAIVPTSKGYRALYTNESPDVWFNDFCAGKKIFSHKGWKFWKWGFDYEARPDPMFMEVTSPPYVIIPTATKGLVQVWGKRKGFENVRFEEKTEAEFKKNNDFWNQAKIDKKDE